MLLRTFRSGVLVVLLQASLAGQTPAFIGTNFPVGGSSAAGDLNSDGKPDLITAGVGVQVLLGNGDGTFRAPVTYPAGNQITSVVVGDFNNDGKLDVAVASADTSEVSILLGNGDGTLQAARNFPVNRVAQEWSIVAADFNRDGNLDVAVADQICGTRPCNTISVLLGNGDGTLQTARHVVVGPNPGGIAVGDFNGDHIPDLAVTSLGNAWILTGKGDGSFRAPAAIALPAGQSGAFGIAVGDFNRDGRQDLTVAAPFSNLIYVILGNGDGTFQTPVSYLDPLGQEPVAVAVGDFNKDGKQDLAIALSFCCPEAGDGALGVMLGNGDGTFQSMLRYLKPFPLLIPNAGGSVSVADMNNDRKMDILLDMSGVIGGVTVMLNTTGQPIVPVALDSLTVNPATVAGGTISELTATIAPGSVAPAGNLTLPLTNSHPSIASVPGSLTIIRGMANANIPVQTNSGTVTTATTQLSASLQNITRNAMLTVTPPAMAPAAASITIQPHNFVGGAAPNVDVFLNEPAPFGGADVILTSTDPAVLAVPSPLHISEGALSSQEIATTTAVKHKTTVTVAASYGGQTVSATVTIRPPSEVRVASLILNPSQVVGGNPSTGTVTITAPAPAGGATVRTASSNTIAIPESDVFIPTGQTTGTFQISTSTVTKTETAGIQAFTNVNTVNATLTVKP